MMEEKGDIGNDFSMNIAKSWEQAFNSIATPRTRKIILRTSIVFGKDGGALIPLKKQQNLVREENRLQENKRLAGFMSLISKTQ